MSIVHIAGLEAQVGPHLRQRCAWCGAVLIDEDLSRVGMQVTAEDPNPRYPTWEVGGLVRVDGPVSSVVAYHDGDPLPEDCCGMGR